MSLQRWLRLAAAVSITWLLVHTFFLPHNSVALPILMSAHDNPNSDICRAHGWKPFRVAPDAPPRKVYDLFMVSTELDWLEVRLNTTWDSVDYFVLVEASKTFTGLSKPLSVRDVFSSSSRFNTYRSKIIYHEIEYPDGFDPHSTWDYEDFQRNAMFTQVFPRLEGHQAPQAGDVIVVSDVDEIARPSTLAKLRACQFPRRLTLRSRFYYYSFQFLHDGPEWAHPQATFYQGPSRTVLPNDLRMGLGFFLSLWWDRADMPSAAWHCSSCFATVEEFLTKMASFSHTGMNADKFRDRARIAERVRSGVDLWDRPGETFTRIDDNQDVPGFLLDNRERFGYMLSRDGPAAGFSDYDNGTTV
ncbi:glycosyltransferase [Echria macrotheca]|uniref:Glycosyltransferase n=1 Tax=Echria macrotheca TaxID=438768 RepID=A0AAJ0FBM1_9PEZI|nr:glycosyltransferase [Echria macrotheca]